MSSRLPTSALRRSVSSSIVCEELLPRVRRPVDVVLEQARDRGLDRRDRRAQVVRDGGEERRAELVRRRQRARGLGLRLELAELDGGGELPRERLEHALVLAAQRRAGEREHVLVVELDRRSRGLGALGDAVAARGVDAPAALLAVEHRGALEPEHARSGRRARPRPGDEPARRASASASARARAPSAARRAASATKPLTIARDREEDDEREDVLALADRERVERRREVPVDEQEAADRRGERGPEPADRGDADDEQQEEEQHARQADARRAAARAARSASGGPTAASAKPSATRRRGSAAGRRRCGSDELGVLRCPPGWLMTCTSMPTPDSRITLPITEPRVSRCQRERRLAPMTIWVAFSERAASSERLADVGADDLVVGAAELRRRARAARASSSADGAGEPVLRDGRARRRDRPSPAARSAPRGGRAARRPREPVSATSTRSRVSHGRSIPWRLR